MRCVAVDWSGRLTGAEETIWIAAAEAGRLTFLESGRRREEVIEWVIERRDEIVAVGFDFAFSFPAWFCNERGWRSAREVWTAMSGTGDALLSAEADPFWGRTQPRPEPNETRPALRATEAQPDRPGKSVFQIGGAGAVGTGSIRGMPLLAKLADAGFSVWPFNGPTAPPAVVEIYPRRLYPPGSPAGMRLVKSRWSSRNAHLRHWFPAHPEPLRERAAGSEDAFDAAVSALVMSRHEAALRALPALPEHRLEGWVWSPPAP